MGEYLYNLCRAMEMVAAEPKSIFLGQAVVYPGTAMTGTFKTIPREKLLEMPVAEDMQLGMATGMSLNGDLPLCVYPRINFLLLAVNQLVLHLDKLPLYSRYRPKVLIRTAIATEIPMDPGPQHLGDFTQALRWMCDTVEVVRLPTAADIMPQYERALKRYGSTILVELSSQYT